MAIKTLSIQGYCSIQNMRLTIDYINVIVRVNGCGKSNLYKAVHLLAKAVNGELAETLALGGGMPSVCEQGSVVCNSAFIARSRLRIDTRKWLAAKLIPKVYGTSKIDNTPCPSVVERLIQGLID